jgi:hypothetical protein
MKKTLLLVALLVALVPLVALSAAAQSKGGQQVMPTLRDYVLVPGTPPIMATLPPNPHPNANKPPKYCGTDCLWYTGNFEESNPDSDGLQNADDVPLDYTAQVYNGVACPSTQGGKNVKVCRITGMGIDTHSNATRVDPTVTWDIREGVTTGSGGTVVCSGKGKQTWVPTGRSEYGLTEYANGVSWTKGCDLSPGTTYFMNVYTSCTTSSCDGGIFFEGDQTTEPPGAPGQYGPNQPWDDSYWESSTFGANWEPTSDACGYSGWCDQFSFWMSGTYVYE